MKKFFTLIAAAMTTACVSAQTPVVDYSIDWTTKASYDMWKGGAGTATVDADGLHITNTEVQPNFWDLQAQIANNMSLDNGTHYSVDVVAKAEGSGTANVRYKLGDWNNGATGAFNITAGGDYQPYHFECDAVTGSNTFLLAQFGDFVGTVSFKSVTISHIPTVAADDYILKVDLALIQANPWDSQVLINLPKALTVGKKYNYTFEVKGSVASSSNLGGLIEDCTNPTGQDQYGNSADLQYTAEWPVTTEWKTVNCGTTDGKFAYDRIILNVGKYAGTLYIDNIKFEDPSTGEVVRVDFKTGVAGIASTRSWHSHVTVGKEANDVATGIKTVNTDSKSDVMYNIAGQRVYEAKGIVIKNGKKYVAK